MPEKYDATSARNAPETGTRFPAAVLIGSSCAVITDDGRTQEVGSEIVTVWWTAVH